MTQSPFHAFIDLIKVDQSIVDLEKATQKINTEIDELKKQKETQLAVVTLAKNNMLNAQKSVDQLELELKTLDQQEKQKKERLDNANDYKQYQALKAEIDDLKHKQHQYEDVLMAAWNKLEAMKKEYNHAQSVYPSIADDINSAIGKKESEIKALKVSLKDLESQRPAKEKVVPAEWLEKYAVMRSRVSDPVVPEERGSCSACYYKITQQDLSMLAHHKLLQCKSCYRLLYSPEIAA